MELIKLRIEYDADFKSTTTKNDVIWKAVAKALKQIGFDFTGTQCNDKWRYLKSKYATKKDNMSKKASGSQRFDFDFFEEMDNFLGKKHNIKPPVIASSIRGDNSKFVC